MAVPKWYTLLFAVGLNGKSVSRAFETANYEYAILGKYKVTDPNFGMLMFIYSSIRLKFDAWNF